MSEADKIIESLKNSGRKVEEFYTGNKGSDKNVGSIKRLKQMVEIIPTCDFPKFQMDYDNALLFANDIENILAEREQDKKRIQELEEENAIQRRQLNSAFDNGYIHTDKIRKLIANETIDISGFECIAVEDLQELLEGGENEKSN